MANSTKKPTSSKSTQSAKKNTSNKASERDEYAYYDDLYEKKPRKKKKVEEEAEENCDELYESKPKKKASRNTPPVEEKNIPPASTLTIHRLMPYILGLVTVFIVACFLLASIDGAMGDLGNILRNLFFGFFGWPAYFIPLVLVNLIIYWRRYVDLGIIRRKIIFGASIPLLLSSLIHSLAIHKLYNGVYAWGDWGKSIFGTGETVLSNWTYGVQLHGGGFFGGLFGGFFRCLVGYVGSVLLLIAAIALVIIFYVGLSPRHFIDMIASLISKIKTKKAPRYVEAEEVATDEPEEADETELLPQPRRTRRKPAHKEDEDSEVADTIPVPEDNTPAVSGVEIKPADGNYDPDAMEVLGSIETKHAEKEKKQENKKTLDSLRPVNEAENADDFGGLVDTIFGEAPA